MGDPLTTSLFLDPFMVGLPVDMGPLGQDATTVAGLPDPWTVQASVTTAVYDTTTIRSVITGVYGWNLLSATVDTTSGTAMLVIDTHNSLNDSIASGQAIASAVCDALHQSNVNVTSNVTATHQSTGTFGVANCGVNIGSGGGGTDNTIQNLLTAPIPLPGLDLGSISQTLAQGPGIPQGNPGGSGPPGPGTDVCVTLQKLLLGLDVCGLWNNFVAWLKSIGIWALVAVIGIVVLLVAFQGRTGGTTVVVEGGRK